MIDQGVRTWGRVRHALVASALAFAKLAGRRKLRLLVGGTSTEGRLFDPLEIEDEELGVLWESSDLSPNPSLALEQVLETSDARRRDVVVLSHPRSVAEPDFAAAARRVVGRHAGLLGRDRRAGPGPVPRVAAGRAGQARRLPGRLHSVFVLSAEGSRSTGPDPRGWRGDVEPVPFPFRFGVIHRIERPLFDFDHASRWLLLCTHRGLLHAWKLDGSRAEVLPRAVVEGEVLEQVDAVLGVADGFVVGGRVGKSLVAMHYDFGSRTARAHVLGPDLRGGVALVLLPRAAYRRRPGEELQPGARPLDPRGPPLAGLEDPAPGPGDPGLREGRATSSCRRRGSRSSRKGRPSPAEGGAVAARPGQPGAVTLDRGLAPLGAVHPRLRRPADAPELLDRLRPVAGERPGPGRLRPGASADRPAVPPSFGRPDPRAGPVVERPREPDPLARRPPDRPAAGRAPDRGPRDRRRRPAGASSRSRGRPTPTPR